MPRIKKHRIGFRLDMTPMVDVAFLLLTFFMLTTQFKPPEVVETQLPSSHSNRKLPDTDILMVSVSKKGEVYVGVDSQPARERIFDGMMRKKMETEGKSAAEIETARAEFRNTDGFLVKEADLESAIIAARVANPRVRPVIKADIDADFGIIEKVMDTFKKTGMPTFNLITSLEG